MGPNSQVYNQPVGDACAHRLRALRSAATAAGACAGRVRALPALREELCRRRMDSLNRALALALPAAALRGCEYGSDAQPDNRWAQCVDYRESGELCICGMTGGNRGYIGALNRRNRPGAADNLHAGDSSRRHVLAVPRWVGTLLRHHPTTRTWSMIEVMMLGVLVALIKIADYATVIPGVALFMLGSTGLPAGRDAGKLRLL